MKGYVCRILTQMNIDAFTRAASNCEFRSSLMTSSRVFSLIEIKQSGASRASGVQPAGV
jgi:hypothetical protein